MRAPEEPPSVNNTVAMGTVLDLFSLDTVSFNEILFQTGMDIESFPATGATDIRGLKIIPHKLFSASCTFYNYHISLTPVIR